uniref:Uncharacterized protein n=1 Tax=Chinchilla lanigera TaxID=34839 RepID=A0A8C2UJV5_CHILA
LVLLHGNKISNESLSQSLSQTLVLLQGHKRIFQFQRDLGSRWLVNPRAITCPDRGILAALQPIQACGDGGSQHQRSAA